MTHKEFYTKHAADLRNREKTLSEEMISCDDREARAKIGETLAKIRDEINETESMLAGIDEPKVDETVVIDEPGRSAVVGTSEMRNGASAKTETETRAETLKNESRFTMSAGEARSMLVSSGAIATPTEVGGITDPFSSVSSIVDMVRVEDMTGCGAYKEAYIKAWQEADAGTEGTAANADDPDVGFVNIAPFIINVITYVSKEIRKQTPLQYLAKVQEGAAIALKKKVAAWIVSGNGTTAIYGIANAVDKDGDSMIQSYEMSGSIDDKTLRNIVFAYGGGDNLFGGEGVVLFLNKKDLVAFGDVRSETTLQAVYEIIPDGTNPNTGVIKDGGLSVKYCINANCTAYVDAEATEAGVSTMIVGDPKNYKLGLFGDYEITVSEDYKFAEGMLSVRGEVLVGGNVIKENGFVVVKKVTANP
jgi:hypothetical protein